MATKKTVSAHMARALCAAFLCAGFLIAAFTPAMASEALYTNAETGYVVVIEDDADLLSDSEEEALADTMSLVTEYGNAAFKTIDENYYTTSSYAAEYFYEAFGYTSGTLFLIDMDNRMLYIYSYGTVYDTITDSKADVITDNVYTYASDGDYYTCAAAAFEQIDTLLDGGKIAQPMKYISNALLAVLIALLINFVIIQRVSRTRRAGYDPMIRAARTSVRSGQMQAEFIRETRRFSPVDHGGGGGAGGGGGHGGGGGGGHGGGGGGGHKF